jgi:hypothetical protein
MTAKAKRPVFPRSLGTAGKRCWKALLDDLPAEWELTARELELLRNAARQGDLVAELETALKSEGIIVLGAQGQPRLNAVATELRQSRVALARLLGEIELPADESGATTSAATDRARRAAQARWRRRQQKGVANA